MKKCPYCAEEIQDEAIVCRYCGRDLPGAEMKICPSCKKEVPVYAAKCKYCEYRFEPVSENIPEVIEETPGQEPISMKKTLWGIAVIAIVLVIASFIFYIMFYSGKGGGKSPTATPNPSETAWYMCRHFIENNLKAPSTAKFQNYVTDGHVSSLSDGSYELVMWVDAQNSFGAQIRATYYCKVKPDNSGNWVLVDLQER